MDSDRFGAAIGILIAALIGLAITVYLKPLRGKRSGAGAALVVLVSLWALKTAALRWCPGYYFDIDQFTSWARRICVVGPAHFYGPLYAYQFEYPPGGIYALWPSGWFVRVLGLSGLSLRTVVETPPLIADFVIALTMFAYLRRRAKRLKAAWCGMLLVALNPALLFDTVVWGQNDSVVTALMWLSTLLVVEAEYVMGAAVLAVAVLVKPHALILIPPLTCWVLRKDGIGSLAAPLGAFVATTVITAAPFAVGRPWDWLPRFYSESMAAFRETSVNAFNLMGILGGIRQPETATIFGISDFDLGLTLVLAVVAVSCAQIWRNPTPRSAMLAIFLALFGEFLLGPRMHERYLYPALVFLAPVAVDGFLWMAIFVTLTLNWLFNLAYVLRTLQTVYWIPAHAAPAMLSAALNLVLFGVALAGLTALEQKLDSATGEGASARA